MEEGTVMRTEKKRILSRLMIVFMTATLAFLLCGVPPDKAQAIQLRHTNPISLLPVGRACRTCTFRVSTRASKMPEQREKIVKMMPSKAGPTALPSARYASVYTRTLPRFL